MFLRTLACTALLAAAGLAQMSNLPAPAAAAPPASPDATVTTTLAGKTLTIKYAAPSMRGRKIMGGLVPFNTVWRTGANSATTFLTAADLTIGTLDVPAGSYTLYTLPTADPNKWLFIVNKETGQWGTVYNELKDLGRTPMQYKTLPASQEGMSISFENVSGKTAQLHVKWEKTDEYVTVTAK